MFYFKYKSKIGDLYIYADNQDILEISYYKNKEDCIEKETKLIKKAYDQISEYLDNKRKSFDLPLKIQATDFQKEVYDYLSKISYGKVKTYKEVAKAINHKKAYRAVGSACNKNKFSIVIPCHRVISSSNKLLGYAGGLDKKEALLKLEGLEIIDKAVKG